MKLRLANKVYKRAMLEARPTRLGTFDRAMQRLPRATIRHYWWLAMCLAAKYGPSAGPDTEALPTMLVTKIPADDGIAIDWIFIGDTP